MRIQTALPCYPEVPQNLCQRQLLSLLTTAFLQGSPSPCPDCHQVPGPGCTWDQDGSLAGYCMRLSPAVGPPALPSPTLGATVTDCAYGKCNSISWELLIPAPHHKVHCSLTLGMESFHGMIWYQQPQSSCSVLSPKSCWHRCAQVTSHGRLPPLLTLCTWQIMSPSLLHC